MKKTLFFLAGLMLLASCSTITRDMVSPVALDDGLTLEEKLEHFGARKVEVDYPEAYFDVEEWRSTLVDLINSSEDYILLSTYLGSYSESIRDVYEALERKADEGVRIYIVADGTSLYDQTLTRNFMSPLFYLRDHGVKLFMYNDVSIVNFSNPSTLLFRDHRKLCVFDGKTCVLGGMNLNYISLGAGERSQRDSMFVFHSSSLIEALLDDYVAFWNANDVEMMDRGSFGINGSGGDIRGYILNHMDNRTSSISGFFGSLMAEAKESIVLLPFLPALDKNMETAIRNTVERGVDFTINMPIDDRGTSADGVIHYLPDLLENTSANVVLSEKDRSGRYFPLLHEKLMIVDDRYVVIGSSNFNFRSMGLSKEIVLMLDSPEFAASFKPHLETIMDNSVVLDPEGAVERKKEKDPSFFTYLSVFFAG